MFSKETQPIWRLIKDSSSSMKCRLQIHSVNASPKMSSFEVSDNTRASQTSSADNFIPAIKTDCACVGERIEACGPRARTVAINRFSKSPGDYAHAIYTARNEACVLRLNRLERGRLTLP